MKMDKIDEMKAAYANNDIRKCVLALFWLMISYNADIKAGQEYDHDLKHILFKTNFIHNPIGMKYTKEDYEKTITIIWKAINIAKTINDPDVNTSKVFREGFTIDKRIIKDLITIVAYTECFYRINDANTKRMDECETGKLPFVEQLISIILFHQDQDRLVRKSYQELSSQDYLTGMEFSIADRPVNYYEDVKSSVSDNFETMLEGMDQLVNYLYYRFGKNLKERIEVTDIELQLIHPYENAEFERYFYTAVQRYLICRVEESIRYGYYTLGSVEKSKEGIPVYAFSIENDGKYKARRMGVFRREYQVRKNILMDFKNNEDIYTANETISILADELVKLQKETFIIFDFNKFYPEKEMFLEAEKVAIAKERIVEYLTKDYYLNREVKGIKVHDMLNAYKFLDALSEILIAASQKYIDDKRQETLLKEISIVDISYLSKELARIHDWDIKYAEKLLDRFIFHEKNNRDDDVFAQPLLKISQTQVIVSQALFDQVNLDRAIERQFIRYKKNVAEVGHAFEDEFLYKLGKGYSKGITDLKYKEIPNFQLNTEKVKYQAFDGKEIEFDVISILGEYLILTELKSIMTSYDLNDLEERKKNIKEAVEQLQRRKESVKYDWEIFKKSVSVELPDEPYDEDHIILVACTDAYDYTPLKSDDVFITDDSSYLKYFTNPYIDKVETQQDLLTIENVKNLWKCGYPEAKEFMEYLMNPVSILPFDKAMKRTWIPALVIDENDCAIFCEEYVLDEDPVKEAMKLVNGEES